MHMNPIMKRVVLAALHNALKQDVMDVDRLSASYRKVLHAYRTGEFGRYTLDALHDTV